MESGSSADAGGPQTQPGLTGRQRRLYERLVEHAPELAAMYAGALAAMASAHPDCWAQAAHSARELMEKLARRGAPEPATGVGHPRDRQRDLLQAWDRFKASSNKAPNDLLGDPVDRALLTVLRRIEALSVAAREHQPKRESQSAQALTELGLTDLDLPEGLQEADLREWVEVRKFFESASHHGSVLSPEAVRSHLDRLEAFLMRWVPETFADLDELDELIEGDGNG